jgi:nickel superoxide dismutase
MKTVTVLALFVVTSLAAVLPAFSHCEVPCGIYDDKMRIELIREHITTIEKAMNKITALSQESPVNFNQLVRWTTNKEKHAEELQHIVYQYFMTQRIMPADASDRGHYDKYVERLTLLHRMLVYTMKTKQTTDLANVEELRALTDRFNESYFNE